MRGKAVRATPPLSIFLYKMAKHVHSIKCLTEIFSWVPEVGYKVFHSIPLVRTKPVFVLVLDADVRELQALEEFIKLRKKDKLHAIHKWRGT